MHTGLRIPLPIEWVKNIKFNVCIQFHVSIILFTKIFLLQLFSYVVFDFVAGLIPAIRNVGTREECPYNDSCKYFYAYGQ